MIPTHVSTELPGLRGAGGGGRARFLGLRGRAELLEGLRGSQGPGPGTHGTHGTGGTEQKEMPQKGGPPVLLSDTSLILVVFSLNVTSYAWFEPGELAGRNLAGKTCPHLAASSLVRCWILSHRRVAGSSVWHGSKGRLERVLCNMTEKET